MFLSAVLLSAGAAPAEAARRRGGKGHGGGGGGGAKRVGLVVTGKDARHVEKGIVQVLKKHGYTAMKGKPLVAAAKSGGGLDSDGGRAAAAKRLKLRAVIVGEIGDRGRRAELRVHGTDGQVLTAADFKAAGGGKKLAAAVGRGLWPKLGDTLESAKPGRPSRAEPEPDAEKSPVAEAAPSKAEPSKAEPSKAEPSKAETKAKAEEDPWASAGSTSPSSSSSDTSASASSDIPAKKVARNSDSDTETLEAKSEESPSTSSASTAPALDAMAGVRLVTRDLSWVKDNAQSLQPFSMPGAAAFGFQVAWYPAAHFTRGWPTQIGIAASGEYVPGISATTMDGTEFPATDSDYWGGLRGRMPFGSVDAALTLAYGQHAYAIRSGTGGATRADLAVPDTRYSYARIGADARVALPYHFALMAGAAYRAVLDAGKQGFEIQSQNYFSRATVTALDASAAVGYRFLPMFEARLGVDFRRYGLDMHPQPTDARVVSGGIDHYLAFWANLAVMLDGRGRAAE